MELKVEEYQLPERIGFNFEELKQELTEKVGIYEAMVYTDEQVKEAKADKANLNKLKKALNDERIRREKEYLLPFTEFKNKINEIISIVDKPIAIIDKQVKEFEEKRKTEKSEQIKEFYNSIDSEVKDIVKLEKIFDDKWLNASVRMSSIEDEIKEKLKIASAEMETIKNLPFAFEALEEYKRTLDINKAIAEGQRLADIQKRKEEEEARRKAEEEKKTAEEAKAAEEAKQEKIEEIKNEPAQEPTEEKPQWINFSAYLTVDQALALKNFFIENNILFNAI